MYNVNASREDLAIEQYEMMMNEREFNDMYDNSPDGDDYDPEVGYLDSITPWYVDLHVTDEGYIGGLLVVCHFQINTIDYTITDDLPF